MMNLFILVLASASQLAESKSRRARTRPAIGQAPGHKIEVTKRHTKLLSRVEIIQGNVSL